MSGLHHTRLMNPQVLSIAVTPRGTLRVECKAGTEVELIKHGSEDYEVLMFRSGEVYSHEELTHEGAFRAFKRAMNKPVEFREDIENVA